MIKPIFLLADSQLLFWKCANQPFPRIFTQLTGKTTPKAVYIGTSNGDKPLYYEIFRSAMQSVGVTDCRMLIFPLDEPGNKYLMEADIILFSGGDIEAGWAVFKDHNLSPVINQCYQNGAVIIGISAGAVQLGPFGWREAQKDGIATFKTFALHDYIVSPHDEENEWHTLKQVIIKTNTPGLAIPFGCGVRLSPDKPPCSIKGPAYLYKAGENGIEKQCLKMCFEYCL